EQDRLAIRVCVSVRAALTPAEHPVCSLNRIPCTAAPATTLAPPTRCAAKVSARQLATALLPSAVQAASTSTPMPSTVGPVTTPVPANSPAKAESAPAHRGRPIVERAASTPSSTPCIVGLADLLVERTKSVIRALASVLQARPVMSRAPVVVDRAPVATLEIAAADLLPVGETKGQAALL